MHACIVCASLSCPNLRGEAFRPGALDAQMTDQAARWLANPTKGFAIVGGGSGLGSGVGKGGAAAEESSSGGGAAVAVRMSRIFLWFPADFAVAVAGREGQSAAVGEKAAGPLAFVRQFRPRSVPPVPEAVGEVKYFTYSWALNDTQSLGATFGSSGSS